MGIYFFYFFAYECCAPVRKSEKEYVSKVFRFISNPNSNPNIEHRRPSQTNYISLKSPIFSLEREQSAYW